MVLNVLRSINTVNTIPQHTHTRVVTDIRGVNENISQVNVVK